MKTLRWLLGAPLFLASLPLDAAVLVRLDATDLPEGPLEIWENTGEQEGDFEANPDHVPSVITVDGVKGVDFDGDNDWYVGPTAWKVAADVARSVEAWVHNPSFVGEETVFAWGRRGGPEGTNVAFNHGNHAGFGAVGHWGSPDIGWGGTQVENQWTYIVYTYDSENPTTRVYTDGALANSEEINALATHEYDNNDEELPFRIGAQNLADGSADNGRFASLTIARIRVHDATLSDEEIATAYEQEKEFFTPPAAVELSIAMEGEDIVLSWPAGGSTWNVEVSSDLAAWTRLQEGNASGSYTDSSPFGENAARFYRVVP